jgi:hypothetical protein
MQSSLWTNWCKGLFFRIMTEKSAPMKEQAVIDVLCGYFGEKLDISEEKEEYIIEASLISADLRRVVCGDQVGMVALQELLTVQDGGFLKRKKVADACA